MKIHPQNKVLLVWLLAAVFIMPSTIRNVHIGYHSRLSETCNHSPGHAHEESEKDAGSKEKGCGHNSTTCPTCQFVFSSFTESVAGDIPFILTVLNERTFAFYQGLFYNTTPLHNYLRGPPAA